MKTIGLKTWSFANKARTKKKGDEENILMQQETRDKVDKGVKKWKNQEKGKNNNEV